MNKITFNCPRCGEQIGGFANVNTVKVRQDMFEDSVIAEIQPVYVRHTCPAPKDDNG